MRREVVSRLLDRNMLQTQNLADMQEVVQADTVPVDADREHVPFRPGQAQVVLLDAGGTELALDGERAEVVLFGKSLDFVAVAALVDEAVECARAIIFVFKVMTGDVEAVFIDADGVGAAIHLRADVVFEACKVTDELWHGLYAGLVCVRNVIGEGTHDIPAGRRALLDLPLANAQKLCNVRTFGDILRQFRKHAERQNQPLADLPLELHGSKAKTFSHNVGLLVTRRAQEFELRPDRQERVDLEVNAEIHRFECILVDDALPAEDMGELNPVGPVDRFDVVDALDTGKFSQARGLSPLSSIILAGDNRRFPRGRMCESSDLTTLSGEVKKLGNRGRKAMKAPIIPLFGRIIRIIVQ